MASELCMNCFEVKGEYEVCCHCGYAEGTPPEQPHYLKPGTILKGHFIVGTAIGAGGFGITYKAYDTTLGVIVAIKEFFPVGLVNRSPGKKDVGLLSGDKETQYNAQIKRFLMEAQSIAQFGKARDIVNVFDYFEENNTAYIVMEYIDGVLLKDYLEKQGALPVKTAFTIIEPVIDAVKKIHASGIVHRDISPDNIFISGEDSVKVFDFGAAILNDDSTMAVEKVIKVGYSAPEQYRDNSGQGYFTDIYSIGAILYQMITGQKPIESTEREYKDELKSPLELGFNIEANLDRAIMEALAVQPDLRFQGIQQFEDAINGKRRAEYPKVKLKIKKRKRIVIACASVLVLATVAVGGLLFNNKIKHSDKLYNENAKIEKDTDIVVWVDSEKMKSTVEKTVARANMKVKDKSGGQNSEQSTKGDFTEEQKKENPKITVDVVNVSDKKHKYKNINYALKAAEEGKEKYPDMVQTDNISDISKYEDKMVSYHDNVYAMLNLNDYCFMAAYSKYYPDMKQMPTSFDIVVMYALKDIKIGKKSDDVLTSGWYGSENDIDNTKLIELDDIIEKADNSSNSLYIDNKYNILLSLYKNHESVNSDGTWDKSDKQIKNDAEKFNNISSKAVSWYVDKNDYNKKKKSSKNSLKGMNILSGIEYRKALYKTQAAQGDGYKMIIPTIDGKMLVRYSGTFSIFDNKDKSKTVASERLVYYMVAQDDFEDGEVQKYPLILSDNGLKAATDISGQENLVSMIKEIQTPCILLNTSDGMINEK